MLSKKLMVNLFKNFSSKKILNEKFPKIPYEESIKKFGTDKPDLRNPLIIQEVTEIFKREDVKFDIFKKLVKTGSIVKAIITKTQRINQEVFLIILISGQKSRGHQV